MNWRQRVGLALAAVTFAATAIWAVRLHWRRNQPEGAVLRIAHANSFHTIKAGFDRVAREYERLHPGVRIEQILVPQRSYISWLRTRLAGGIAPDIVEMNGALRNEDHVLYFHELTQDLAKPNPYNAGTPLEGRRWRDTFLTGLQERPNYVDSLLAFYSTPSSYLTYRVICNRDLLEKTFGRSEPPRTAQAFAAFCDEITRRSRAENLGIVPIAIENENGRTLLEGIMRNATQDVLLQIDPYGHYWNWDDEVAIAYLLRRWSFATPAVQAALTEMSLLGRALPPGFDQVGKGEGTFSFMQGKAVFLIASSLEYTMFREVCPFPLSVARLPAAGNDPRFVSTEGNVQPVGSFGIVNNAGKKDLAVDFLRFLGSQPGNRMFIETSRWLPAVKGIPAPAELTKFVPDITSRPPGLSPWMFGKGDHIDINRHLHALIGPHGSADTFTAELGPEFGGIMRRSLAKSSGVLINSRQVSQRFDTVMGSHDRLVAAGTRTEETERNTARILEVQAIYESRVAYYELALDATDETPGEYFAPLPPRPLPVPPGVGVPPS